MSDIKFFQPDPQDWQTLRQIAEIDRQAFAEDGISVFNLAQFTRSGAVFCLPDNGLIVAYTVLMRNIHDGGAVVFGFAVDEKKHGAGYGSLMIQKLIETACRARLDYLELTMNPLNEAARILYMKKAGFVKIEELLPHPEKNEPRWLMRLELKKTGQSA
jgi:ribosomal protein S18 acetylase RimI-like enzyme